MAADRAKEKRVIAGLAQALGLSEDADAFSVLTTVAQTLGCTVAADGTTAVMEEEAEPAGRAKKRRRARSGAAAVEVQAGDEEKEEPAEVEEDEGEEDEEEEEGEEGQDEEEDGEEDGDSGDELQALLAGGDEELEDFDLTVEPVRVEDPRTPDLVAPLDELEEGEAVFQWLVSPVDVQSFEDAIQDEAPLLVTRPNNREYFSGLLSREDIDKLLRGGAMQYCFNVDVTSYSSAGKKRANFNFNGDSEPEEGAAPEMADADVVWRRFADQGCSVRLLHPQRFSDPLWRLVARLESFLQCPVGCNAYLTPPSTQGFAPHWDDIDAFVLQLEGSKRWRLHAPTDPEHVLPRYSSRDFSEEELGEVALDVVLQPGDILYMPRGTVHQAESQPDGHSLHITISANQQRSWAVFLEEALPEALRLAAQSNRELRRTLPRDFFDYMGLMHEKEANEDEEDEEAQEGQEGSPHAALLEKRRLFTEQCADLVEAVLHRMPLDGVADQMAVQFLQQRLPPPPRKGSAAAAAAVQEVGPDTIVRLAQRGIARLVIDGEGPEPIAEVHHCMANRRDLHAHKPSDEQEELEEALEEAAVEAAGVLEFPVGCAELLDILLSAGSGADGAPEAVPVGQLPAPEDECGVEAAAVVRALLEAGVLEVVAQQA